DLGGDPGDVDLHVGAVAGGLERREGVDGDEPEQRRAQAHEDVRAEAGRLVVDLPLEAERGAQPDGQEHAQHHEAVVELEQLRFHDPSGSSFWSGAHASRSRFSPTSRNRTTASAFSPSPMRSRITPSPNVSCPTSSPTRSPARRVPRPALFVMAADTTASRCALRPPPTRRPPPRPPPHSSA